MAKLLTFDGQVLNPTAYIYIYIYIYPGELVYSPRFPCLRVSP